MSAELRLWAREQGAWLTQRQSHSAAGNFGPMRCPARSSIFAVDHTRPGGSLDLLDPQVPPLTALAPSWCAGRDGRASEPRPKMA